MGLKGIHTVNERKYYFRHDFFLAHTGTRYGNKYIPRDD